MRKKSSLGRLLSISLSTREIKYSLPLIVNILVYLPFAIQHIISFIFRNSIPLLVLIAILDESIFINFQCLIRMEGKLLPQAGDFLNLHQLFRLPADSASLQTAFMLIEDQFKDYSLFLVGRGSGSRQFHYLLAGRLSHGVVKLFP